LPSSISPTYRVARSPFGAGAPSEQLAGNMVPVLTGLAPGDRFFLGM